MSYEYDVFVSYRREEPVKTWVRKYFAPELRDWLNATCGPTNIFFDEESLDIGVSFTPSLEHALRRSKVMIPVWAPGYFYSSWCVAELKTMFERERSIGFRTAANPRVLVAPIRFGDGDSFPISLVGDIKWEDFHPFAFTAPGWVETRTYMDFQSAIKQLATGIAAMLPHAPVWSKNLTVVHPGAVEDDVLTPPTNARSRL
jgi:hypothetical protein